MGQYDLVGCERCSVDKVWIGPVGVDRIVHFGLRILRGLAFGFRFSSKIQTAFSKIFPLFFRFERQLSTSNDLEQPRNANVIERNT